MSYGLPRAHEYEDEILLLKARAEKAEEETQAWRTIAMNHLDMRDQAESKVEELKKLSSHNNGEILLGWMDAHRKAMDQLEKAEAKIKELEHYKHMIEYTIEYAPPYIANVVKEELEKHNPSASTQASALDDTPKAH